MTDNGTAVATVETLVAEVRTLMVGSRQVTLSVAKQLDVIDLERLTVFGRARIDKEWDWVIGADPNGVLSVATYQTPYRRRTPFLDGKEIPGKVVVCNAWKRDGAWNYLRLGTDQDSTRIAVHESVVEDCGKVHGPYRTEYCGVDRCPHWDSNGNMDALVVAVAEWSARQDFLEAIHRDAANAPLIVLAGLK